MQKELKNYAYIDGANLHKGIAELEREMFHTLKKNKRPDIIFKRSNQYIKIFQK